MDSISGAMRAEQEFGALFAAAVDAIPAQVAILDRSGVIIATNQAWDAFGRDGGTGAGGERYHGANYLSVCAKAASEGCQDAATVLAGLTDVLRGREPSFQCAYSSPGPFGRHFTVRAVRLTDTCMGKIVVLHEDNTTLVRSERYSRLQEKLLRTVLKTLPVGVLVIDRNGRLLVTNPACNRTWGVIRFRPGERKPLYPASVADDGTLTDDLGAAVTRALSEGHSTERLVAEIAAHDGAHKIVSAAVVPFRDEQEHVTGCVMVHEDVSEATRAVGALQQSERLHRAILDSVADGILVTASDGTITFLNQTGAQLLGRSNADLVGRSPVEALGETLGGNFTALSGVREAEVLHPDGTKRTYEFASAQVPLGSGGPQGAVVSFRDVTQRKDLQSQLSQSQKLEAIGQLAAGIAHEINTPTQYIGDNIRFLRDSFADFERLLALLDRLAAGESTAQDLLEEARALRQQVDFDFMRREFPQAIAQSLDGVERVTKIVYSMKDFAHPDRQDKQALDLNRVVTSATTVCRNEWKYVADLELDLEEGLPTILGFAGDIGQVVLNLVVNAAHAIGAKVGDGSKGKGRIVVRTRTTGDAVTLEVADDGCGIPTQNRARIFEQFFTTKGVGKGTGQGLALVRRIAVERHGGTTSFESTVGTGTTFRITLPRGQ